MFYEIRRYECFDGQRDKLAKLMEGQVIPFQTERGMEVVGSFVDDENPNVYIWIRRFENEEQKAALYDAVYGAPAWTDTFRPLFEGVLNRETMQIMKVSPLPSSKMQ